jgi:D-alanine--poly(phosphoribitol) ligase subunit 2
MEHADVLQLIYASIDETNRQLPAERRLVKSPQTLLLGEGSVLDSLGLISFIVAFEEALESVRGIRFNLLEEEFLGDATGPLRDVRSLAAFVEARG